jgi:hypothetical protein
MQNTARHPKITVSGDGSGIVSQAGALLLTQTLRVTGLDRGLSAGLDRGLSAGLARWRAPRAVRDPGKIIADLAVTLALGGDCLADIAVLRAEPVGDRGRAGHLWYDFLDHGGKLAQYRDGLAAGGDREDNSRRAGAV